MKQAMGQKGRGTGGLGVSEERYSGRSTCSCGDHLSRHAVHRCNDWMIARQAVVLGDESLGLELHFEGREGTA